MQPSARAYENLPLPEHPRSWAEIDLRALRENYRALCGELRPGTVAVAVVKADAYGHGAANCAPALAEAGCSRFAVSCAEEGIALRKVFRQTGKAAHILILGYTDPDLAPALAEFDLAQAICSRAHAAALCRAAKKAGVRLRAHYALDTGMNRLGFPARSGDEIKKTAKEILRLTRNRNLRAEGLFTHFAFADEPEDPMNDLQAARFAAVRELLFRAGTTRLFCHTCNSAAALTRPRDSWDGVRFGIALWGIAPVETRLSLRPVMRLCTRVTHLHRIRPGERIGYGGEFRAARESLIATLPIGYADGWLCAYRGAIVTLRTAGGARRVPLVGRICMDQCMLDVTGTGARVGDEVVLFGEDPNDLPALAGQARTIPYESLTLISARVLRVYVTK